jgi:hypothetical protein
VPKETVDSEDDVGIDLWVFNPMDTEADAPLLESADTFTEDDSSTTGIEGVSEI